MSEDTKNRTVEVLLQEHQELVQLYVHEDSLAWQLNLAFLAMNGVVITGAFRYGLFDVTNSPGLPVYVLLFLGVILNVLTYFVFQRSKIHREGRLVRAYEVEDELAENDIDIQTLSSCERTFAQGNVRELGGPRRIRWDENVEVLRFRWSPLLLAGVFVVGIVWLSV